MDSFPEPVCDIIHQQIRANTGDLLEILLDEINVGGYYEPIRRVARSQDEGPTVLNVIAFGVFGGISVFWVEFKFQKT